MNQQTAEPSRPAAETCVCREFQRLIGAVFQVPDATRQHLTNSRIEFLKAVRSLIDARISHLAQTGQKGAKVVVE